MNKRPPGDARKATSFPSLKTNNIVLAGKGEKYKDII